MTDTKKVDAWMPMWIGDYLADTMKLSRDLHGGYLLMLFAYWRNKGPLDDDDEDLAAIVKATPEEWSEKLRSKLAKFFTVENGVWSHTRADKELRKAGVHKLRALAGGANRWDLDDTAAERGRHLRSQRLSEARTKGTHTAFEWEALKAFHGIQCCRCKGPGEVVKDHITPIYQGGSDSIENLQPLCRTCNASKGPENIDHRLEGWRDAIKAGIPQGIKRLPDASTPPSPIETKKTPPPPAKAVGAFEIFWHEWPTHPRKVAMAQCRKKWESKGCDAIAEEVIASVLAHKLSPAWLKNAGEFIPAPMVWLNQNRWQAPIALPTALTIPSKAVEHSAAYLQADREHSAEVERLRLERLASRVAA